MAQSVGFIIFIVANITQAIEKYKKKIKERQNIRIY